MTDTEAAFVEAMGQYLGSLGMTPMAGRVWAYLLICDPKEQTAGTIAEELHASRGAISGTVRTLETAGLIQRRRKRGDRKEYFIAPPGTFHTFAANAASIYRRLRQIFEQGLEALADKPPPVRDRLEEAHAMFQYIEREIPIVLDRFINDRSTVTRAAAS